MSKTKDNEQQIDIKRMIEVVLDRIVSVVVITIIFGLIAYALSEFLFVKKYESSVTLVVNNEVQDDMTSESDASQETKTYASDITASQDLVPTCIEIIKSDTILEQVSDEIGRKTDKKYSAYKIRNMLTVEEITSTYIIKITVEDNEPVMAREIAQAIGDATEEQMQTYIPRSSIKVLDRAKVSSNPASPNVRNNTILGALLGFVFSISFIILKELFDVRVKSADDLVARFEIPVLGSIPEIYISYDDSLSSDDSET